MRPLSYRSDELRSLLMRTKIATLDELKQALGTSVDVTVFRKIKPLDYLTSYSHRGRYYTLREIARFDEKGLWSLATDLYTAIDRTIQQGQLLTRRNVESVPMVADASVLEVSEEELKASILLFYSLLDERQRRLYAGLESLKLGRGGDRSLADFLDLDPHTVARGRQQLLAQDVEVDRARKAGGGRRPVEKKRPK